MSQKNINNITYCEIDNTHHKSMTVLVHYLKKKLNIEPKNYYDRYIKKDKEGVCPICNNSTKFISIGMGYKKYCSIKCKLNDPILNKQRRNKAIETNLRKYGVEHISQITGFGDKVKQTKLKKYGDPNYINVKKMQDTCLKKYGNITYTGTDEYNKKYKKTCLEKYGTEHHTQFEAVKEKSKQTCLEKYGVEHVLQANEVRDKIDNTMKEKYGGYTYASKELNNKAKVTMLKRYGVKNALQNKNIKEKQQNTNIKRYGGIVSTKNNNIIQKIKKTNLGRYGVENTFNLIQTKNTFLEKYGVINPSQIPEVKEKIASTCLEKYGNKTFFGSDYATNKIKETCLRKYGVENIMQNKEEYLRIVELLKNTYKIKRYITIFGNEVHYQSKPELEFIKFCEKYNIKISNGPFLKYKINNKNRIYYSDFLITEEMGRRIIEIKRKHGWYKRELKSGVIKAKARAAIAYSKQNNYLPYKILFENKI